MSYSIDNAKIIGVTGSVGKSSTAFLVHEYLKYLGEKSILYSSIKIDSPASFAKKNTPFEGSLRSEKQFVNALNEAAAYKADYVILEVSAEALRLGAVDNIHFDVKIMTEFYKDFIPEIGAENYLANKLKFFTDDEDSTCILNLSNSRFKEFYKNAIGNIVLYDAAYVSDYDIFFEEVRKRYLNDGDTIDNIKYYPQKMASGVNHSYMQVKTPKGLVNVVTTLAGKFSLYNIVSAIAILDCIDKLDIPSFQDFISREDLEIPGRLQDYQFAGRTVIVDYDRFNALQVAKEIKDGLLSCLIEKLPEDKKQIDFGVDIRRIVGVISTLASSNNYTKKWLNNNPQFQADTYALRDYTIPRTYNFMRRLVTPYIDKCYLTVDSPGDRNPQDIIDEVAPYIDMPTIQVPDRKEAIRRAILDSEEGDCIVIPGRGSRRIYFTSNTDFELWSDVEIVKEAIKEFEESKK